MKTTTRSEIKLWHLLSFVLLFNFSVFRADGQATCTASYSFPGNGNSFSACFNTFQITLYVSNFHTSAAVPACTLAVAGPLSGTKFLSSSLSSGNVVLTDSLFTLPANTADFTDTITLVVEVTGCERSYPFHVSFSCAAVSSGGGNIVGGACTCGTVNSLSPCLSPLPANSNEGYVCVPIVRPRIVFDHDNSIQSYTVIPPSHNGDYFLKYDEVYRYYKIIPSQGITDHFSLDITAEEDIEVLNIDVVNINSPSAGSMEPLYNSVTGSPFVAATYIFSDGTSSSHAISQCNSNQAIPHDYLESGTSDCIVIRERIRMVKVALCDNFNLNQGSSYHLAVQCDPLTVQPECSFDDMTLNVLCEQPEHNIKVDVKNDLNVTPSFACCQYSPQTVPYFVNYSAVVHNNAVTHNASNSGHDLATGSGTIEITGISFEINSDYFDFDDQHSDGVQIDGHNVGYVTSTTTTFPHRKIITIDSSALQSYSQHIAPPTSATGLQTTLNNHNGYNIAGFPTSPTTFLFLPESHSFKLTLKNLQFTGCNLSPVPQPFSLTSNGTPAFLISYNQMCAFSNPPSIDHVTDDQIEDNWIVSSDFAGDASLDADPPQVLPANPVSHITAAFDVTSDDPGNTPHPTPSQPWDLYQINNPNVPMMHCPNSHYRAVVHLPAGYSITGTVVASSGTNTLNVSASYHADINAWVIPDWSGAHFDNPASVVLNFDVHSECTSGSYFDPVSIDFQANCDNDHCESCYMTYGSSSLTLFNDCGGSCTSAVSTIHEPNLPESFHFLRTTFGWANEGQYQSGNTTSLTAANISDHEQRKMYEGDIMHATCSGNTTPLSTPMIPGGTTLNFDICYTPPGQGPYSQNSNIYEFVGGSSSNLQSGSFHIVPLNSSILPFDVPVDDTHDDFFISSGSSTGPPYNPCHWTPTVLRIHADTLFPVPGTSLNLGQLISQYECSVSFEGDFRVKDTNTTALSAMGNYQNMLTIAEFTLTPPDAPDVVPIIFSCDPSVRNISFYKLHPKIEDDFSISLMNGLFGPGWRRQFFGFNSTPDECTMRYLLYTRVETSTFGDNFPNEYRPVLDWPDEISFEVPHGMYVTSVTDPLGPKAGWVRSPGGMPGFTYNIPVANFSVTPGGVTDIINLTGLHTIAGYRSIDRKGFSRQGFALQLTRTCVSPGQPSNNEITIDNGTSANPGLKIREEAYDVASAHPVFPLCAGAPCNFNYNAAVAHEVYHITAVAGVASPIPATTNPVTIPLSLTSAGSSGSSIPNMWVYFTTLNVSSTPGSLTVTAAGGSPVTPVGNLYQLGSGGQFNLNVNFDCMDAGEGTYDPVTVHVHYGNSCDGYHPLFSLTGDPTVDFNDPSGSNYFPCFHNTFNITILPQQSEPGMTALDTITGCDDVVVSFDVSNNASGVITNAIITPDVLTGFTLNPFISTVQVTSPAAGSVYPFTAIQSAGNNPMSINGTNGVLPYILNIEDGDYHFTIGTTLHYELHYVPECLAAAYYPFHFSLSGTTSCPGDPTERSASPYYYNCRVCCTDNPNTLSPIDFYSTNGSAGYGDWNLNHNVTVFHSFTFDQANVDIAEGVTITVNPNAVLNIQNNSSLHGCTYMWSGINVLPGGRLNIVNNATNTLNGVSTIADAEYGAHVFGDGEVRVEDSYFKDNIIGLQTDQTSGSTSTPYVYVERSVFAGTGSFKTQFSNQAILPETHPRAGIILNNVAGVTIGGNSSAFPNEFKFLNEGIGSYKTNITILNTKFHDIGFSDTYSAVNSSGLGTGIYSAGPAGYVLTQTGFGKYADIPSFENCKTGITAFAASAFISENYMRGVGTGIKVGQDGSAHGKKVKIHDNRIESTRFGIWGWNNNFPRIFDITDNDITFGNPNGFSACGISMNDMHGTGIKNINSNTIAFNGRGNYGIRVTAGENYHINYNDVTLTDNILNMGGIQINDNEGTELSCNHIVTTFTPDLIAPAPFPVADQAGIAVVKSKYNVIGCNEVQNTTNGVFFSQDCSATDFKGNSIGTGMKGLSFDAQCIIGPQDFKGNVWYGSYTYGAYHPDLFTASFSPFKVDANCNPLLLPPSNYLNHMTFNPQNNSCENFECIQSHVTPVYFYCYLDLINGRSSSNGYDSLDIKIALRQLHFDEYDEEMKWSLEKYLYEKLVVNPAMRDTDTTMYNFYESRIGTIVEGFTDVKGGSEDLYAVDEAIRNAIDQHQRQIQQNLDQITVLNQQLENGALSETAIAQLNANITALKQNMESDQAYIDTAIAQIDGNKLLNAETVLQLNLGLVTTETIQENQKKVNELFLRTVAQGRFEFSGTQINDLYNIAIQCPVSGGNSVYEARSMYSIIDPDIIYDDKQTCLEGGIVLRKKKEQVKRICYVYPNPAKDEATLVYNINSDGFLEVYNSLGQLETICKLNCKLHQFTFDTHALFNGVYFYKVKDNSGSNENVGRLIITR